MLLRLPALLKKWPRSKTTIYADIADGVFVPPVHLGLRCSAWPEHEVNAIIAARAAGATDDDVRQLVARLVAERQAPINRNSSAARTLVPPRLAGHF